MTRNHRPWLTRNLVVLSLVSLTQDAASELMYPLMPLFLAGVLSAPAVVLGVVEGSAEVAAGVSKFLAGRRSDRTGRRVYITTGYGLAGIGKAIVASSVVWPTVLVGRVVDRIGKGVRSAPRDAMITASVEPHDYARALGFHRSADTFGAVLGPIFALLGLSLLNNDVRAVMWWAIVPAMASVLLTFLVREHGTKIQSPDLEVINPGTDDAVQPDGLEQVGRGKLPRTFWNVALPIIIVSMVNLPDTLLLLRLSQLGADTLHVVLAYIAFNAVYTLAAYPAGLVASNLSPRMVYGVGLIAFGISYAGIGLLHKVGVLAYVLVALYGFFPALTDGIGKSMVATATAKKIHGTAQGVYQSLQGGAILIAGTWGGLAWSSGTGKGSAPFLIAGIAALTGAVYFVLAGRSNSQVRG